MNCEVSAWLTLIKVIAELRTFSGVVRSEGVGVGAEVGFTEAVGVGVPAVVGTGVGVVAGVGVGLGSTGRVAM